MIDKSKISFMLLLLILIVVILIVAVFGLFIRMRQLEKNISIVAQSLSAASDKAETTWGLPVGTILPKFQLTDDSNNSVYSSDNLTGHKTLLVFVSPTCSHCIALFPNLKAFSEERKDIKIVMISFGTDAENKQVLEEQGFNFPVLKGDTQAARSVYLVPGTPFLYLVDENMTITSSGFAETLSDIETLVSTSSSK